MNKRLFLIVIMILVTVVTQQPAEAQGRQYDQACADCARPEIDFRRYSNVAWNVWFHDANYNSSWPVGAIQFGIMKIIGLKGCASPPADFALTQFNAEFTEISFGPFTFPVLTGFILRHTQLNTGTTVISDKIIRSSPRLVTSPALLPYPIGAQSCGGSDESGGSYIVSVTFPNGDDNSCRNAGSPEQILLCAENRGFECVCGAHDGRYFCTMPNDDDVEPY